MRPPPRIAEAPRYPVIAGTALLAIGVTIAYQAKVDISPLFATAMIRRGELWRLVTSILPHGGVFHILFDAYWFWAFGTVVEDVYGHFKTAVLIVFFAVGSSAWQFGVLSGGIGLSGVGYGLFGLVCMLSRRDPRFEGAVDSRIVQLFVGWFFLCIITTWLGVMPIANIAHGSGAVLGILTGLAITQREQRVAFAGGALVILAVGMWTATAGRPRVNLSNTGGYEEAQWGYDALVKNRNQEAVRWFRDAVTYQPKVPAFWYDLAIADERVGDQSGAVAAFRNAANLGDATAQQVLASLYQKGGKGIGKDTAQAVYWYRKLSEQNDADALNDVAWEYATSADPQIRNPEAALQCARKAVSLDKEHPDPNHLDTLAESLYVNGQYEEAVKTEQQAIALLSSSDDHKGEFQERLQKYQLALKNVSSRGSGK